MNYYRKLTEYFDKVNGEEDINKETLVEAIKGADMLLTNLLFKANRRGLSVNVNVKTNSEGHAIDVRMEVFERL